MLFIKNSMRNVKIMIKTVANLLFMNFLYNLCESTFQHKILVVYHKITLQPMKYDESSHPSQVLMKIMES
jgi:hypothetical protein